MRPLPTILEGSFVHTAQVRLQTHIAGLHVQGTSSNADRSAVQEAFNLAPRKVQEELCRLKQIFITPQIAAANTHTSWGLWENPLRGQTPSGERPESFIAISADVITPVNEGEPQRPFLDRENNYVRAVARGAGASIRHSTTTTLTAQQWRHLSILSVLVHEIGHIKWHRDNIYSSLSCFWTDFVVPSWSETSLPGVRRRPWAPPFDKDEARGGSRKNDLPQPPGDFPLTVIRDIYDAGFATAVGAVSPEEDFVETYRISAFRKMNPPVELTIRIPPEKSVTQNASASGRFECVENSLF